MFVRAYALAKKTYESQYNEPLGKLISVSEQVVSGVNLKFVFENSTGGQNEIIVYVQPWTDTYQVTSIKPSSQTQWLDKNWTSLILLIYG